MGIEPAIHVCALTRNWTHNPLVYGMTSNQLSHTDIAETNKMKRQSTELENIFTNDILNKGLISKINKELIQQHQKNPKQSKF